MVAGKEYLMAVPSPKQSTYPAGPNVSMSGALWPTSHSFAVILHNQEPEANRQPGATGLPEDEVLA